MKTEWVIAYCLFSLVVAYILAIEDERNKNEDITLFHILGNLLPALIISVPFVIILIMSKMIIKKRTNETSNKST